MRRWRRGGSGRQVKTSSSCLRKVGQSSEVADVEELSRRRRGEAVLVAVEQGGVLEALRQASAGKIALGLVHDRDEARSNDFSDSISFLLRRPTSATDSKEGDISSSPLAPKRKRGRPSLASQNKLPGQPTSSPPPALLFSLILP
eukprot:758699-Hanusia_phi.AAC.8